MTRQTIGTTTKRARAGLNNQRLVLIGLFAEAHARGVDVVLPDLVNINAADTKSSAFIDFGRVFDLGIVREFLNTHGIDIAEGAGAEQVEWIELFNRGAKAYANPALAGFVDAALAALRPPAPIIAQAEAILAHLGGEVHAVQLRVERDWQIHCDRLMAERPGWDCVRTPEGIFDRIAATPFYGGVRRFLIFCDEAALVAPPERIAADIRASHGFDLTFKSMLPRGTATAELSVEQASIDFEVGLHAKSYVGLSQSTFSNLLCATKAAKGTDTLDHFTYHVAAPVLFRRCDRGRPGWR
ncbi:hypothetical protein [Cereibacter sphaeroides]|uniref:hypothetical protein n=1 Tax=Cereibacter sphaeroides TaxID=1063 RepID=UPI001F476760|nr:hypothetical protein [Cereibacter sphaeroides]MCE6967096.1 hypothetical protein [Cereibacter sphaeroides]